MDRQVPARPPGANSATTVAGVTLPAIGPSYVRGKEETDERGSRQALYKCEVAPDALLPGFKIPPGTRASWRYRGDSKPLRPMSVRRGSELLGGPGAEEPVFFLL